MRILTILTLFLLFLAVCAQGTTLSPGKVKGLLHGRMASLDVQTGKGLNKCHQTRNEVTTTNYKGCLACTGSHKHIINSVFEAGKLCSSIPNYSCTLTGNAITTMNGLMDTGSIFSQPLQTNPALTSCRRFNFN